MDKKSGMLIIPLGQLCFNIVGLARSWTPLRVSVPLVQCISLRTQKIFIYLSRIQQVPR
jgi:hypothetical protein